MSHCAQVRFSLDSSTPVKRYMKSSSLPCSCRIDISQYNHESKISVKYTKFRLTLTPSNVHILCRSAVGNGYFSSELQLCSVSNYEFPWLIRFGCADEGKSCLDSNHPVRLTCRVIN